MSYCPVTDASQLVSMCPTFEAERVCDCMTLVSFVLCSMVFASFHFWMHSCSCMYSVQLNAVCFHLCSNDCCVSWNLTLIFCSVMSRDGDAQTHYTDA